MRYYNGTSAYKLDEQDYRVSTDVRENIEQRKQTRIDKRAKFIKSLKTAVTLVCAFGVCIGILFANAVIIEKSSTVNAMQTELNAITEENTQLKLDIEKNTDLKKIEEIAVNELGMKRPDKYQIVYVNVEQSDYAEVANGESDEEHGGVSAAIDAVGSGVEKIVEYIH